MLKVQKRLGKSIIAFARKVSSVIYAMLKNREPCNIEKLTVHLGKSILKERNSSMGSWFCC